MGQIHKGEKIISVWTYFLEILDLVLEGALRDTDLADPFYRLSTNDQRKARDEFRKETGRNLPF
ncbi:MAG: hypothetical protein Greene07147_843 [Parcubacteria group bacterium Greene0714_7]|nr:MAG: hypothetical protein Greene07147_843 [Parcubacteria group bacterium Greene0714_7]